MSPLTQQYHDPITFKVFNDHTAIAAIKPTGNVYARESIDRLNLKARNLHDVRLCPASWPLPMFPH